MVLLADGTILTTGYNDNGQCGQGCNRRISRLTPISFFQERECNVLQVHAYNGCEHTLVVAEEKDGTPQLYSFGYNLRGQLGLGVTSSEAVPRPVQLLTGKRVSIVSCSYHHTLVSCEGETYSFGRNDYGQLGHGDTGDKREPAIINALNGKAIISMACGQYHSVVVTNQAVYSFGKNDYGQLGLESADSQRIPHLVSQLENKGVIQVRCGYYHTIVLCSNSSVFSFGRNDYGQLGIGNATQKVFGPQLVEDLCGKGICKISAGCYHTVCAAENGVVFVFGRNNHGQLGCGNTKEQV